MKRKKSKVSDGERGRKVKKLRFEADCIVPSGFPPPDPLLLVREREGKGLFEYLKGRGRSELKKGWEITI